MTAMLAQISADMRGCATEHMREEICRFIRWRNALWQRIQISPVGPGAVGEVPRDQ